MESTGTRRGISHAQRGRSCRVAVLGPQAGDPRVGAIRGGCQGGRYGGNCP